MHTVYQRWLVTLVAVLATATVALSQEDAPPKADTTPDAEIHATLAEKFTIDYSAPSWPNVLNHLRAKSGLEFVQDRYSSPFFQGRRGRFYHVQIKNAPLSTGLRRFLHQYNQDLVVTNGQVLITSAQKALALQMRQPIRIEVRQKALQESMRKVAASHGVSLLFDPAASEQGKKSVTLTLDNVTAENGLRLLAFTGGLKTVRVGRTIVVTTVARAELLPKETLLQRGFMFEGGVDEPPGIAVPGFPGPGVPVDPAVPDGVPEAIPNRPPGGAPFAPPPDTPVQAPPPGAAPAPIPLPTGGGR